MLMENIITNKKAAELMLISARIRRSALEMVYRATSGHLGGSFSICELLTALYFNEMNIDPQKPHCPDRDRLVLSKGHCTPALYSALAARGYFPQEELSTFRDINSHLSGHAEMNHVKGVDMSTGSLGQGFSAAVGMALAGKLDKKDYRVYAILGDGEIQEGQVWEAAMFAASKGLGNLVGFTDYNKLQIDGTVAQVNDIAPLADKWAAFGWNVIDVADGNDVEQVSAAVKQAKANRATGRPTMVILNTLKGCGVKWIEEMGAGNHNTNVSEEQAKAAIAEIREG